jgi:hypothetical protein
MAKAQEVVVGALEVAAYFAELEDLRSEISLKHPLVSVVTIAVMAVLAGADCPTAIHRWKKIKAGFSSAYCRSRTAFRARTSLGACWRRSIRKPSRPGSARGWRRCGPGPQGHRTRVGPCSRSTAKHCGGLTRTGRVSARCTALAVDTHRCSWLNDVS